MARHVAPMKDTIKAAARLRAARRQAKYILGHTSGTSQVSFALFPLVYFERLIKVVMLKTLSHKQTSDN